MLTTRRQILYFSLTVTAVFLLLFGRIGGLSEKNVLRERLMDSCHFPLFFLTAVVIFLILYRRVEERRGAFVTSASTSLLMAALAEILQPLVERSGTMIDLVYGFLGVGFGLSGVYLYLNKLPRTLTALYLFFFALSSAYVLHPAYDQYQAILWQKQSLPLLADFEDPSQLLLWKSSSPTGCSKAEITRVADSDPLANHLLRVETGEGWCGAEYRAGYLSWLQYSHLRLEVFNLGETFPLKFRIDDDGNTSEYRRRFNKTVTINSGFNKIAFDLNDVRTQPEEGELNLKRISRLIIFTGPGSGNREFLLDNISLE